MSETETQADKLLADHTEDLIEINNQRKNWLHASSFVFVGLIMIIFSWNWLHDPDTKYIWWVVASLMMIVSINWWYWTMRVIRKFMSHQHLELHIIVELCRDVREVRKEISILTRQLENQIKE